MTICHETVRKSRKLRYQANHSTTTGSFLHFHCKKEENSSICLFVPSVRQVWPKMTWKQCWCKTDFEIRGIVQTSHAKTFSVDAKQNINGTHLKSWIPGEAQKLLSLSQILTFVFCSKPIRLRLTFGVWTACSPTGLLDFLIARKTYFWHLPPDIAIWCSFRGWGGSKWSHRP